MALCPVLLTLVAAMSNAQGGEPEKLPAWLSFVPEMNRVAALDEMSPDKRWATADDTAWGEDLRRAHEQWKQRAAELQKHVTPDVARSLSRWAQRQMEKYPSVPPLDKVALKPIGVDPKRQRLILESTLDTLPTHHALVTRWLKAYVTYDLDRRTLDHVTITIRGQRLE
jgi:hypothetical protein